MFDASREIGAFKLLNKTQLAKLRKKAIRSGAWFKALRRIDRALIDLTIAVTRCNVRSVTLAKNVLATVEKLKGILESRCSRATREVGFPLAQKISALALKWGNISADRWSSDQLFARFLGVLSMNEPKAFKA